MKRREFVEKLGVGSAAAALVSSARPTTASTTPARGKTDDKRHDDDHDHDHDHRPVKGAQATATVSFGQWKTDSPVDRYPNAAPMAANGHLVIPHQVTIKAGGTVNFVIAGVHQVIVYAPGTKPEDVNVALTRPTTGVPAGVLLINDPVNRVYAGPDPSTIFSAPLAPNTVPPPLRDRVEAVQFPTAGRYLVICGLQPHFVTDNMFGWVRVLPNDDDD